MLEWICPKCGRAVDPGFESCPFCRAKESKATEADAATTAEESSSPARVFRRVRVFRGQPFDWTDVERGFRFGLGFVAAVACAYFVLFLIAYFLNRHEWVEALGRWLYD